MCFVFTDDGKALWDRGLARPASEEVKAAAANLGAACHAKAAIGHARYWLPGSVVCRAA